ncbi:hypothetical protein K6Y74_30805 [Burkholderia cenocepacia]|jgi:hypothetical protein|uniref:hypothetical protein n=1 Tax=Burkholderia cepacia complex TaxID=87882 RepID=UPI000AA542CC|nr:hypothetical protein [Burkholderia cenocepacia]MCW3587853.1 hypothetical protein [Burkholderia cenocepacia]MCW3632736.1 hypothetical protein [Burkholderia cenocepacia]MCW3647668.1 hypothetical protein [Burkholderia cenocepacia]MCW5182191.1 hypothetical protein [Burkholderia cenocepacia]
MSRKIIQDVIQQFIDSKVPQVLAVTGAWGVGKTFALKQIVESYTGSQSLGRYSYASVFGAQSIVEVRTLLLAKTRVFPIKRDVNSGFRAGLEKQVGKFRVREAVDQLKEMIPFGGKHVVVALETVAGSFLKDTIIVLDDIERHSDKVKLEDLLGLVSELKEQAGCKVILIFNEDGWSNDENKIYSRYSEKVVDQKLKFSLSPQEAVELGLPADVPLRALVAKSISSLEITNIRVIHKIVSSLGMIYPLIKDSSDYVKQQAATTISVFACSLYERGRGFPEPDVILQYNAFTYRRRAAEEGRDEDADDWVSKLGLCGFTNADEFDAEILDAMRGGYVQGSSISEKATMLDAVADRARLDEIFTDAWKLFHDRLDVTADGLAEAFVTSVAEAARVISPLNLNSTVKLLRELGFDEKADEIIEIYIDRRKDTPRVFDIDHQSRLGDVDDPRLRARCLEAFNSSEDALSLEQAATIIVKNEQWDDRIVPAFVRAQPAQIVDLLMANQGPALQKLVNGILRLPVGLEYREQVSENVTAALTTIGRRSLINRIKVRRWGVIIRDE